MSRSLQQSTLKSLFITSTWNSCLVLVYLFWEKEGCYSTRKGSTTVHEWLFFHLSQYINHPSCLKDLLSQITADTNQPGVLTHQMVHNWYQPAWCVDSSDGSQLISTSLVYWLNTVTADINQTDVLTHQRITADTNQTGVLTHQKITADINQPGVLTQYCYSWYQPHWCVDSILLQLISTRLMYWLIRGLQLIPTRLVFWLIRRLQLISTSLVCWLNTVTADINQSGVLTYQRITADINQPCMLTQFCYSWYQPVLCVNSILLKLI